MDQTDPPAKVASNDQLGPACERPPNTQECVFFGRKMSNVVADVESDVGYVVIGSERDDEIYFGDSLSADECMLRERVKITVMHEPVTGDGFIVSIDLEDVLRFAAKYCGGLYRRCAVNAGPNVL